MKTKNIIFSVVLIVFGLSSCDDMDFLIRKDESLALINDSIKTEEHLKLLMRGAYQSLSGNNVMGGTMYVATDNLADDAGYSGATFEWVQVRDHTMNFFNPIGRTAWQNSYSTINYANQAAFSDISDQIIGDGGTELKADAAFIRALCHFHLVRLFAKPYAAETKTAPGVVIRTRGFTTLSQVAEGIAPRSTVDEVYEQVITDLKYADSSLPASRTIMDGMGTPDAAKAILAKVYFYKGDMANVIEYASKVVNDNSRYDLDADMMAKFARASTPGTTSKEVIFMHVSRDVSTDPWGGVRGSYNPSSGTAQYYPSADLLAAYNKDKDSRFELFYKEDSKIQGGWQTKKFDYPNMDAIVIAYNELILYYAEALASENQLQEAVNWLNKIESRAYGSPQTAASAGKEAIISAVQKERRLELALQGERIYELKRLKSASIRGDAWDSSKLLFQIPDSEQNGNPNIVVN
ncbi:membrane protein [Bacteroidia bacterium]|nr:membrane protein [Bacteroidia bacterium]